MARKYFDKFPIINYDGYNVRNLTTSAKLMNKYVNLPYSYYEYDVDREQRADQVANEYYDDPYMTWMIYYANRMVDPYYDWILPEAEFSAFIIQKYGTLEAADRRIIGFRTNWDGDNREISPAHFQNMFGEYKDPHVKYWDPTYSDDNRKIISYVRKKDESFVSTNKLAKVAVTDCEFERDDMIDVVRAGSVVGSAEVVSANTTTVYIKHIIGFIGTGDTLRKYDDETVSCVISELANTFVPTADSWTVTNIDDEEYVYWEPHTVLSEEIEKNSRKAKVKLVDPLVAIKVADKLEEELNS